MTNTAAVPEGKAKEPDDRTSCGARNSLNALIANQALRRGARLSRIARVIVLIASDQLAVIAATLLATGLVTALLPADSGPGLPRLLPLLSSTTLLAFCFLGLYRRRSEDAGSELGRIASVASASFGVLILSFVAHGTEVAWIGLLAVSWTGFVILAPSLRKLTRLVCSRLHVADDRMLIVGKCRDGDAMVHWLSSRPSLGQVPIGPLDANTSVETIERIAHVVSANHLVVMPEAQHNGRLMRRLSENANGFERVTFVPLIASIMPIGSERYALGQTWGVSLRTDIEKPANRRLKRALDLAFGVPLFLVSLPVIALMAVCIKIVSPGPAVFRHRRVGLNGEEFDVFKLRSMYPDAESRLARLLENCERSRAEWQRRFKLRRDPRLLPFLGPFLRRTSLDELPQLINVLRGEMSLVGPRPMPPYHLEGLLEDSRRRRHRVLPGLTGLWQISERSNGDPHNMMQIDDYYMRNWSIWLDLSILAATGWVTVSGRGAH